MLSKQDQLKSNRLRPKPSQKNKDNNSNHKPLVDKAYMTWVHEVKKPSCFSCDRPYFYNNEADKTDLHHIKEASTDLKNDHEVIALCSIECHKLGRMLSVHGTPKKFKEVYPLKVQRLAALKLLLEYEHGSLNENT